MYEKMRYALCVRKFPYTILYLRRNFKVTNRVSEF